jgi:hypothetical protein
MTKADKILIVFLMVTAVFLFIPIWKGRPASDVASVYVKEQKVLQINLSHDDKYVVEGTLGEVHIEVKDHKIRVTQENSPHHYCSKQGFVSTSSEPIVCLPNETVVRIEGKDEQDTMIQ